MDGDPETLARPSEHVRDELPGPGDGLFLEIVAEAEVAEHLEERVMAGGVPDVLEIVVLAPGAHATLAGDRAVVVEALPARQSVLELHHAGVGEQQRRVVARHQAARGHYLVATRTEKLQVRGPDLRRPHDCRLKNAKGRGLYGLLAQRSIDDIRWKAARREETGTA